MVDPAAEAPAAPEKADTWPDLTRVLEAAERGHGITLSREAVSRLIADIADFRNYAVETATKGGYTHG